MSEFNERNWKEALISLYAKARTDQTYRTLCLTDPMAAIKAVSDIDMPPVLKVQFFDQRSDFVYGYLLPPVQAANPDDEPAKLVRWATMCTFPTCPG